VGRVSDMSDEREKIRAATVTGSSKVEGKLTFNGISVDLRAPTIRERAAIARASKAEEGVGPHRVEITDMAKFQALMVIASTFVPGTMTKVYGPEDVDTMVNSQAGSWFDYLQREVMDLLNPEKIAKNSTPTTSSSAS
jgi:hypothetical protein